MLKLISTISAQDHKFRLGAHYLKVVYSQESMHIMSEFTESQQYQIKIAAKNIYTSNLYYESYGIITQSIPNLQGWDSILTQVYKLDSVFEPESNTELSATERVLRQWFILHLRLAYARGIKMPHWDTHLPVELFKIYQEI